MCHYCANYCKVLSNVYVFPLQAFVVFGKFRMIKEYVTFVMKDASSRNLSFRHSHNLPPISPTGPHYFGSLAAFHSFAGCLAFLPAIFLINF